MSGRKFEADRRLDRARAAYLAGDWDALEIALGISQADTEGTPVLVETLRDSAGGASPEGADHRPDTGDAH